MFLKRSQEICFLRSENIAKPFFLKLQIKTIFKSDAKAEQNLMSLGSCVLVYDTRPSAVKHPSEIARRPKYLVTNNS